MKKLHRTDRVHYPELRALLDELYENNYKVLQLIPINEGERFVVISVSLSGISNFTM